MMARNFSLFLAFFLVSLVPGSTAQAGFFPEDVQELCKKANQTKLVADQDKCVEAQFEVAERFLKESFAKALTESTDQAFTLTEQKQWLNAREVLCPMDNRLGPVANYWHLRCLYAITVTRAYELASSVLPQPQYPKKIEEKCAHEDTSNDKTACSREKLAFDKKILEQNYQAALAKSPDKARLESEQRQWLADAYEVCPFDPINIGFGTQSYLDCIRDRTRIRSAQLAGESSP